MVSMLEEMKNCPVVLYTAPDGTMQLDVKLENETVWLTREQMAILFGRDYKTIAKHVNNALKEELAGEPVVTNLRHPKIIADNTLVALTLMIAESRTEEKDIMVKVVVNLINQENQ